MKQPKEPKQSKGTGSYTGEIWTAIFQSLTPKETDGGVLITKSHSELDKGIQAYKKRFPNNKLLYVMKYERTYTPDKGYKTGLIAQFDIQNK